MHLVLDDIFCRSSNEELEEYDRNMLGILTLTFKRHLVLWVTIASNTNLHLKLIYVFSVICSNHHVVDLILGFWCPCGFWWLLRWGWMHTKAQSYLSPTYVKTWSLSRICGLFISNKFYYIGN